MLQIKLDQPVSDPTSPRDINNGDTASNLSTHIKNLRGEVNRLRAKLLTIQVEQQEKLHKYANEEKQIREENLRLQRKLQLEVERREALCRQLSESETSLEIEDERHFNEMTSFGGNVRPRGRSSPIPYNPSPSASRPLSPGNFKFLNFNFLTKFRWSIASRFSTLLCMRTNSAYRQLTSFPASFSQSSCFSGLFILFKI